MMAEEEEKKNGHKKGETSAICCSWIISMTLFVRLGKIKRRERKEKKHVFRIYQYAMDAMCYNNFHLKPHTSNSAAQNLTMYKLFAALNFHKEYELMKL